jgi:hypothetical protein
VGKVFIIWFIFCGISGIILYIWMMNILDSKGLKSDHLFVNYKFIKSFWTLIKREQNKKNKRKYILILITFHLFPVIYLIGGYFLIRFS